MPLLDLLTHLAPVIAEADEAAATTGGRAIRSCGG